MGRTEADLRPLEAVRGPTPALQSVEVWSQTLPVASAIDSLQPPQLDFPLRKEQTESDRQLRDIAYSTLIDLSYEGGFLASGKGEMYACAFGRDSMITSLKVLRAHERQPMPELLDSARRSIVTLRENQGTKVDFRNGERPGKIPHEIRFKDYEHLVYPTDGNKPWLLSPEGKMIIYDSVDSTPLYVITNYEYYMATKDEQFLQESLPSVVASLRWMMDFGDINKDGIIKYDSPENEEREGYGGLLVQSWTDSHQSIRQADGRMPVYPIAPVEVQGIAWRAAMAWSDLLNRKGSDYLEEHGIDPELGNELRRFADRSKKSLNEKFIYEDNGLNFAAQALNGNNDRIQTVTGNPLILAWASYQAPGSEFIDSIVEFKYRDGIVKRSLQSDMFHPKGGIRTMSTLSPTFNGGQDSYHNGSMWVMLNGLAEEGLGNWGYGVEAEAVKNASLEPFKKYKKTLELNVTDEQGNMLPYRESNGRGGCWDQAWSAAAYLDMLTLPSIEGIPQVVNRKPVTTSMAAD